MTSLFDQILPPEPDGIIQSIWIEAYADAWVALAPDRSRLEGANQGLISWQTMGHMNPFVCAKKDLNGSSTRL